MVTITNCIYEPSSSILAQGNDRKIRQYEDQGYYVQAGGYGSYVMVRPSTMQLYFTVDDDETVYHQSVKQLIRDYFGVQRVTKKRLDSFVAGCRLGIIDLKYSKESGLYI